MTFDLLDAILPFCAYLVGTVSPSRFLLQRRGLMPSTISSVPSTDIASSPAPEEDRVIDCITVYEKTSSLPLGFAVALFDCFKGLIVVALVMQITSSVQTQLFSVWAVVFGHCFNIISRQVGARGLTTALGAMIMIHPLPIILWGVMYATGYGVIRRLHAVGAMSAIIGTPILLYAAPDKLFSIIPHVATITPAQLKGIVFAISLLCFMRFLKPIQAIFRAEKDED
jgi:glycerol-3-phosphate acyltransferase PlsY